MIKGVYTNPSFDWWQYTWRLDEKSRRIYITGGRGEELEGSCRYEFKNGKIHIPHIVDTRLMMSGFIKHVNETYYQHIISVVLNER